jgi:iron complex transport system substrate-binding protein
MRAAGALACVGLLAIFPAAASMTVVDDTGAQIELAQPARRIVSLAPHLTEQLFAIGAGERIVGTTDFADYPPAAREIPRVARAHSVDLERIATLKPDLIVIWGSGFPPAVIDAIRRLGAPVFISEPAALADIASSMARLGALTSTPGDRAATEFMLRVEALRKRYGGRPPVSVFYQVWSAPLMTLSGRHVVSEAIRLCGGRNVFADLVPIAPQVSTEAVLAANPEIIVTAEPDARASGALDSWKQFSGLAAVENGALVTLDANRINRHGPRMPDEIAVLCEAIDRVRRIRRQVSSHSSSGYHRSISRAVGAGDTAFDVTAARGAPGRNARPPPQRQ